MKQTFLLISTAAENQWVPILQQAVSPLGGLWVVSAEEAETAISEQHYDLCVIDASLVRNVVRLISRLQTQCPELPIIVADVSPTWRRASAALRAGAVDYIRQPTDIESLRSAIQAVLETRAAPRRGEEELSTAKATVLLADNSDDVRRSLAALLELEGYKVVPAANPIEAQRILDQGGIDLAILDLRLADDTDVGDRSGLVVARESAPLVPKIILTAYSSVDVVREALRPQADGRPLVMEYLSKADGTKAVMASIERSLVQALLVRSYEEARKQAVITHRVRLVLIIVGSVIIIGGGVLVLLGQTPGGVLGMASGVIVEAIAGFFSKLSEDANKRMDRHHRELLKLFRASGKDQQ